MAVTTTKSAAIVVARLLALAFLPHNATAPPSAPQAGDSVVTIVVGDSTVLLPPLPRPAQAQVLLRLLRLLRLLLLLENRQLLQPIDLCRRKHPHALRSP